MRRGNWDIVHVPRRCDTQNVYVLHSKQQHVRRALLHAMLGTRNTDCGRAYEIYLTRWLLEKLEVDIYDLGGA